MQEHKIEKLVPKDNIISLQISCDDGSIQLYRIQLLDDILIYRRPKSEYYIVPTDKRKYCIIEYNGNAIKSVTKALTLDGLYEDTCNGIIKKLNKKPIKVADILEEFKYEGSSLSYHISQKNQNWDLCYFYIFKRPIRLWQLTI